MHLILYALVVQGVKLHVASDMGNTECLRYLLVEVEAKNV